MTCDGCPNLVITPYAPWCNYDGTRKPLLYVRECPKEKNQQSRKAEGDGMKYKILIRGSDWEYELYITDPEGVTSIPDLMEKCTHESETYIAIAHDKGALAVNTSKMEFMNVSEVVE